MSPKINKQLKLHRTLQCCYESQHSSASNVTVEVVLLKPSSGQKEETHNERRWGDRRVCYAWTMGLNGQRCVKYEYRIHLEVQACDGWLLNCAFVSFNTSNLVYSHFSKFRMVRPYIYWMLQKAAGQVDLDESHAKPGTLSPHSNQHKRMYRRPFLQLAILTSYSIHSLVYMCPGIFLIREKKKKTKHIITIITITRKPKLINYNNAPLTKTRLLKNIIKIGHNIEKKPKKKQT